MLKPLGFLPRRGDLHAPGHNNFTGYTKSDKLAYTGGFTLCMFEGTVSATLPPQHPLLQPSAPPETFEDNFKTFSGSIQLPM